ncbi:CAP domain-containing protein [Salinibacillus xinjiangensis]|uniref:CAP domain-containing protein n=1 Tax=Salinibacillus xinjiangensis TaxID=1229268 RepID=A0A6G1X3J7_9BACI|nr:CAP domain-containing protein [Salinibacillus xinjiangensis]MRG85522.1 hypothetical protein [Salinibacillus xinjiangensis]
MKKILGFVITVAIIYLFIEDKPLPFNSMTTNMLFEQTELPYFETNIDEKKTLPARIFEGDLFQLFSATKDDVLDILGEPDRKDPTSFGYEWWVYEGISGQYIQVGMKDQKSVTVFATGTDLPMSPVNIGDKYSHVEEYFPFNEKIEFETEQGSYHFELDDEELTQKPLVKFKNDYFAQFYFDTFTNELSSLRLMDSETLLHMKPFSLKYYGRIPEASPTNGEWEKIQAGREKQILAISNQIRQRFLLDPFQWDESVAEVAFSHSKDMVINNYFSHYDPDGDGLKERLTKNNVKYLSAGENIAAQYPDAASAVEGWLNSEGHRRALLNADFTHLGSGVYRDYYTQNFVQKLQ